MLDIFEEISRLRASGERGALATVVSTRGSTPGREAMRLLVAESGRLAGTVGGGSVEAEVVQAAREVIETETPRRLKFRLTEKEAGTSGLLCGGEIEIFVEAVTTPALAIFGAGHVSRDLCDVAARVGFRVTVADDRADFANAERFPMARKVIAEASFESCFAEMSVTPSTYCVVVTRGHALDMECTAFALGTPAPYVGLIGSRRKVRTVLLRLRDAGHLEGVDLSRLHAPIGVDLGGGTAGEIAVSIAAELIAHRRRRGEGLPHMRLPSREIEELLGRPRIATEDHQRNHDGSP